MSYEDFKKAYENRSFHVDFLLQLDQKDFWPDNYKDLMPYYQYLKDNCIFSGVCLEYPNLYFKLYKHQIVSDKTLFDHIFLYTNTLRNLKEPMIIRPIQNIGFILTISAYILNTKDYSGYYAFLESAYEYCKQFYSEITDLQHDFLFAIEHSRLLSTNNLNHIKSPNFNAEQIYDFITLTDKKNENDNFCSLLTTFVYFFSIDENNNFNYIKLGHKNICKILPYFDVTLYIFKHINCSDKNMNIITDCIDVVLDSHIQNKNNIIFNIIKTIDNNELTYHYLVHENQEFSNKLSNFLINNNLFFPSLNYLSAEQFAFIFHIIDENLQKTFIENVLTSNPLFNQFFDNEKINNLVNNEISFKTYESNSEFDSFKNVKEIEIYLFLKYGFNQFTTNFNSNSLMLCYFYIEEQKYLELNQFILSIKNHGFLKSFKDNIINYLEKELQFDNILSTNNKEDKFKIVNDLILSLELNDIIPKSNDYHNIIKF